MKEEVLFLHCKAKYVTIVTKTDNGCMITYPPNYFLQPALPSSIDIYSFIDNKLIISSIDGKEKEIEIYGYENRFLVMTDMVMKIKKLGMSTQLVLYYDGLKKKKGLLSILPELSKDFSEKENIIKENYLQILECTYFPEDAKKEGILEGFNNINSLIVKGEF